MNDTEFAEFAAAHPLGGELSRLVHHAVANSTFTGLSDRAIDPETGGRVGAATLYKLATNEMDRMPSAAQLRAIAAAVEQPYDVVLRAAIAQWYDAPQHAGLPSLAIPSEVAAHVLWHLTGTGSGYPAGSFTSLLLTAWEFADTANSGRLAAGWPAYGAAIALIATPGGIQQLQTIAGT